MVRWPRESEDDPHHRAIELAKLLLGMPRLGRVDVVARSFHPDLEKLQAMARQALVLADKERAGGNLTKATEFENTAQTIARIVNPITAGLKKVSDGVDCAVPVPA